MNYFKKQGIQESAILKNLNIDKQYLQNTNNWIPVKNWHKMIANCQMAAPFTTLDDWHEIGFQLKEAAIYKLFEMIAKIIGLQKMYTIIPRYANNFNTHIKVTLNRIGPGYADYSIDADPSVMSDCIGRMVRYTSGGLLVIADGVTRKAATVDILLDRARLKTIVETLYKIHSLAYSTKDEHIYINNRKIGRRIQLLKEPSGKHLYSNKYSYDTPWNASLILDNLIIRGQTLLHKGDIFDAPHGRVVVKWGNQEKPLNPIKNSKLKAEILKHLNDQIFLVEQSFIELDKLKMKQDNYVHQLDKTIDELQETKTNLKFLWEKKEEDQKKLEKTLALNIKKILFPKIEKVAKGGLKTHQKVIVEQLKSDVDNILKPISTPGGYEEYGLTPTELTVAQFIKGCMSSKEIAEALNISIRTVETHRRNIRKKMNISNMPVNLELYLKSIAL